MARIMATLVRELREAIPATIFFFLAFHLLIFTKAVILEEYRISLAGSSVATVGALLVAKAILIVDKLPLARLFAPRLLFSALWKSLLFGAVAMLFRLLDELLPQLAKHAGLMQAVEHLWVELSWPQFLIMQLWLYLLLFQYVLTAELVHRFGAHNLRGLLLGAQDAPQHGGNARE